MYRKEFLILSAVAIGIFALVAATSLVMERALQYSAQMLAADTLPGLVNAGDAMSRMNDNWQSIRLLTELPAPAGRSNLIARIQANSTVDLWRQYQEAIFDPRDKALFAQTQNSRENYKEQVQQYFDLVNGQKLDEARRFLGAKVEPDFKKYKDAAASLFQLNTDIGEQRAQHIIELSRWLPWVAGLFCVVIFSFGVLVGLKGAFGSLVFATRFSKPSQKTPQGQAKDQNAETLKF
jgi:hypothetical protein